MRIRFVGRRCMRRRTAGLAAAFVATLVAAFVVARSSVAAQYFPADHDLRLLLRYIVEDGEAPAVALGLVEPDGTVRTVAYGDAGPGARPLSARSVFELGELTMPFTATLLMEMVARGDVALDDPVRVYLPDSVSVPAKGGFEITLEHLARHTAGLPAEPQAPHDEFTLDDLYAFLARYDPAWVPGRRRELSTLGYGLLGHALARAAGMPFPELLRERVLAPLGMAHTGYAASLSGVGGDAGDRIVAGRKNGRVVAYRAPSPALQGGTGLLSSAEDMGRFLRANATASDLSGAQALTPLQRAMVATREVWTPFDPEGEGWGLSWRVRTSPGGMLVTHGGRTSGSTSLIMFSPARGIGTVLLAASADFNDWAARDLLFFRSPPDIGTIRVDPAVLARYVGSYGPSEGRYRAELDRGRLFIRLEDDGVLTYQPRGSVRTPLFPISDSAFYMIRAPLTVSFARVGDAMRMTAVVDGREPRAMGRTWTSWRVNDDTPSPVVTAENAPPWSAWRTGTWLLFGVVGLATLALILRPVWRRPG